MDDKGASHASLAPNALLGGRWVWHRNIAFPSKIVLPRYSSPRNGKTKTRTTPRSSEFQPLRFNVFFAAHTILPPSIFFLDYPGLCIQTLFDAEKLVR